MAIGQAAAHLTESLDGTVDVLSASLSIASSLAVLAGFFTTSSALTLAAAVVLCCLRLLSQPLSAHVLLVMMTVINAVAISLVGPGAYSIDARLFGPREIVIPRDARAPRT
jgi:hypothetical protein